MDIYKLKPFLRDLIWGGCRLCAYGKVFGEPRGGTSARIKAAYCPSPRIAESWELAIHKDGECTTEDGAPLSALLKKHPEYLGTACAGLDRFPLLVKLIDSREALSVQVHPGDAYALAHEGDLGKTEMWVIAEADPGAFIYYGFKEAITKEQFLAAAHSGEILDLLARVPVKAGDAFYIPAGTVHAIGAGITLYEVQQNSNVTYRIYDYGRLDGGKPRELHLAKAADVVFGQMTNDKSQMTNHGKSNNKQHLSSVHSPLKRGGREADGVWSHLSSENNYFRLCRYDAEQRAEFAASPRSFVAATFLSGAGTIGGKKFSKGDTFFVPAGTGKVAVECDSPALFLTAEVPLSLVGKSSNRVVNC
ncbi:MAG: class I mannose-6-phosphate isomerase [Firmicutes bacterium]|nr:class I mannose-6-phosphate isomerase [Bacillota bacterium]